MSEATTQTETNSTVESTAVTPGNADHYGPGAEAPGRIAELVIELGAGWARYGLSLGRLALRQSARTLETTGELLGALAEKIEKNAQPPKPQA